MPFQIFRTPFDTNLLLSMGIANSMYPGFRLDEKP